MEASNRRALYTVLLSSCFALSLFCLVYPLYVIRPFRYQGARELSLALAVMQWRFLITAVCAAIALVVILLEWREISTKWRRWGVCAALAAIVIFGALTHINIYEKMFHPLGEPSFISAQDTKLDGAEKVISVNVSGVARAYPIRNISYHHVVNDVVNGLPIVATY